MIIGDFSAQLYGDYVINHEIRIPIKQPVFRRKVRDPVFFLVVHFPELHSRFTAEDSNRTTMLFGGWCYTVIPHRMSQEICKWIIL